MKRYTITKESPGQLFQSPGESWQIHSWHMRDALDLPDDSEEEEEEDESGIRPVAYVLWEQESTS